MLVLRELDYNAIQILNIVYLFYISHDLNFRFTTKFIERKILCFCYFFALEEHILC